MNIHVEQSGVRYELPLRLECFNPKCRVEIELINEFSNGQEIWECPKCHERHFAWTIVAKFEPCDWAFDAKAKSPSEVMYDKEYYSEPISKDCAWCRAPFNTFDPQDDLCEGCDMVSKMGRIN